MPKSQTAKQYKAVFVGWSPRTADVSGYNANDYLPGWREARFASKNEAHKFIATKLGPDNVGVSASFRVEEA